MQADRDAEPPLRAGVLRLSGKGSHMPARSDAQQKAAGAALAAKRGEKDPDELKGASRQMYDSMTEAELDEMASVARKDLPDRA